MSWIQASPQMAAAFLGSSVEAVEAMTIVLAAGVVRGWRPALIGTAAGLVTLAAIVALFGPAIAAIPIAYLQIVVGTALLLFGIRWLRKAILRSAGVVAHHDESAIYAQEASALRPSDNAATRRCAAASAAGARAGKHPQVHRRHHAHGIRLVLVRRRHRYSVAVRGCCDPRPHGRGVRHLGARSALDPPRTRAR